VRRVIIVMMTCPDRVTRHSAWLSIRYDTSSFSLSWVQHDYRLYPFYIAGTFLVLPACYIRTR
jgi:hypothetical protein